MSINLGKKDKKTVELTIRGTNKAIAIPVQRNAL